MLNRVSGKQELEIVNMLIRALSDEIAEQRAHDDAGEPDVFSAEMEEALYELRIRKLLISAFVDSNETPDNTTFH